MEPECLERVWMVPCEVRSGIVDLLVSQPCSRGSAAIWEQTISALSMCPSGFKGRVCSQVLPGLWGPSLHGAWQWPGSPALHFQPSTGFVLVLPPGPSQTGPCGQPWGAGPAQPWKVAPFMLRAWSLMPRWVCPVAWPPSARALACYFFSTVLWPVWTSSMLLPFCNFYFFNRSYHLGLFSFCIVSTREHYGVVSNLKVAKVLWALGFLPGTCKLCFAPC